MLFQWFKKTITTDTLFRTEIKQKKQKFET